MWDVILPVNIWDYYCFHYFGDIIKMHFESIFSELKIATRKNYRGSQLLVLPKENFKAKHKNRRK